MRFNPSTLPLTPDQREVRDRLYREYCDRPRNRDRLHIPIIRGALMAAAGSVARHGPPPSYNQRLGYRTAKRNRARAAAKLMYGDPLAPDRKS